MAEGKVVMPASGLPRSQARWSVCPNTWQLAHEASPLEYDNGMKIVYPVITNVALGVLGMGMLIPMALRWRSFTSLGIEHYEDE